MDLYNIKQMPTKWDGWTCITEIGVLNQVFATYSVSILYKCGVIVIKVEINTMFPIGDNPQRLFDAYTTQYLTETFRIKKGR